MAHSRGGPLWTTFLSGWNKPQPTPSPSDPFTTYKIHLPLAPPRGPLHYYWYGAYTASFYWQYPAAAADLQSQWSSYAGSVYDYYEAVSDYYSDYYYSLAEFYYSLVFPL